MPSALANLNAVFVAVVLSALKSILAFASPVCIVDIELTGDIVKVSVPDILPISKFPVPVKSPTSVIALLFISIGLFKERAVAVSVIRVVAPLIHEMTPVEWSRENNQSPA